MQKWEYQIIAAPRNIGTTVGSELKQLEIVFNEGFGSDGWELVLVDNGIAYFKRPVESENIQNVYQNGVQIR